MSLKGYSPWDHRESNTIEVIEYTRDGWTRAYDFWKQKTKQSKNMLRDCGEKHVSGINLCIALPFIRALCIPQTLHVTVIGGDGGGS